MANTLTLWRGAVEPNDLGAASGNEVVMSRGAVQPTRTYEAPDDSSVQIGVDRHGGYAVEKHIKGNRPTRTQSGSGWG